MVPQESVAEAGHCKWDGDLGIALCELKRTAFQVEIGLLVLSHTIDPLPVIALKAQFYGVVAASDRLVLPSADLQTPALRAGGLVIVPVIFFQEFLTVAAEGHDA